MADTPLGYVGSPFVLSTVLLHTKNPKHIDEKRRAFIASLSRVPQMIFVHREELLPADPDAHFYLAHQSEYEHADALDERCAPGGAYYILFSRVVREIKRINERGFMLPARIVELQAVAFFQKWIRVRRFPGWEYLIGEPEKDAVLDYLHRRLDGEDGASEWTRLKDYSRAARNDGRVTEILMKLSQEHERPTPDLDLMRDLFLARKGLVALLVKARQEPLY